MTTVAAKTAKVKLVAVQIPAALQVLIDKYTNGVAIEAPVEKMFERFNVRVAPFDSERISLFEGLYVESPDDVPPVFVEELPDGRLLDLDGRTREKAAKNLKLKTIRALIFKNVTEADRTLIASLANLGGSRDMKQPDLKLTFDNLLNAGVTAPQIKAAYAGTLPKRTIYDALQISSRDRRKKIVRLARKDVANGMSVENAAKLRGIKVAKLRAAIAGGGDSAKMDGSNQMFQGVAGELGLKFKNFKQSLTKTATGWMEKHGCDELETDNVTALYAKARKHAKEILVLVDEAEQKFKNHVQN
jgi:ParB-like chromosome segregation protein Spo0J